MRKQISAMLVGFLLRNQDEDLTSAQVAQMGETLVGTDGIPDVVMEPGVMNVLNPGKDVKHG